MIRSEIRISELQPMMVQDLLASASNHLDYGYLLQMGQLTLICQHTQKTHIHSILVEDASQCGGIHRYDYQSIQRIHHLGNHLRD